MGVGAAGLLLPSYRSPRGFFNLLVVGLPFRWKMVVLWVSCHFDGAEGFLCALLTLGAVGLCSNSWGLTCFVDLRWPLRPSLVIAAPFGYSGGEVTPFWPINCEEKSAGSGWSLAKALVSP